MTVAVLNPQDVLKQNRFSKQPLISSPETKYPKNSYPNLNRSNRAQSTRGKRSPPRNQNTSPPSRGVVAPKLPAKSNLVMGQVKILKRGEELTKPTPIPAPEPIRLTESKDRVASFYAGSAFIASPPPSSLPLPAFFTKKTVTVKHDDATSDLRRILKLDML
ncbi:hypothetical protein Pint_12473 [Pistacia integerrima]|uniref:Uncharacterized protein n=1 Tax=Pistacia integerrima TaxID=434235 RepID=A0ACC0YA88_9ROSI|nr:hypothetical protein Pint_12473 [Pistacia integerrima]